jgi:hypothetical protein
MSYRLIDFDEFPTVHGKITIPKNTILYRGYDRKYPNVSHRPAYFTSNKALAQAYADLTKTGKLGIFIVTDDIVLYDLRYIKSIILDIFQQRKSNSAKVIEVCFTLALSYGLCSFKRQIELFNTRYISVSSDKKSYIDDVKASIESAYLNMEKMMKKGDTMNLIDPVEPRGFRFGETDNDAYSVLILAKLFKDHVDGYVAPSFYTPFHTEKQSTIQPEFILFNPSKSRIEEIDEPQKRYIKTIHITDLLDKHTVVHFNLDGFEKPTMILRGGSKYNSSIEIHNPNKLFDKGGKEYEQLEKKADYAVMEMLNGKIIKHFFDNTLMFSVDKYGHYTPTDLNETSTKTKKTKDTSYNVMPPIPVSPWFP